MTLHRYATPVLAALLLLTAVGASAASQKVFRCGPDGRVYSQTPCKDGYEVPAADARSPEQRQAAEDVLKRDARLADKMTRERRAAEAAAAAARQSAVHIAYPAAAPQAPPAASAVKKRTTKKPAAAAAPQP